MFDSKIMVDHVKVNIIQHFIILPYCLSQCQIDTLTGKYLKCCQEKIRVFDSKIMVDYVKVNIIQHFIILPYCLSQCQNGGTSRIIFVNI